MPSVRQQARDNAEKILEEQREMLTGRPESTVVGLRSRDPEEVAEFMQRHFNQGFALLNMEVVGVDVVYYVGSDPVEQLGRDAETVIYMVKTEIRVGGKMELLNTTIDERKVN